MQRQDHARGVTARRGHQLRGPQLLPVKLRDAIHALTATAPAPDGRARKTPGKPPGSLIRKSAERSITRTPASSSALGKRRRRPMRQREERELRSRRRRSRPRSEGENFELRNTCVPGISGTPPRAAGPALPREVTHASSMPGCRISSRINSSPEYPVAPAIATLSRFMRGTRVAPRVILSRRGRPSSSRQAGRPYPRRARRRSRPHRAA